MLWPSWEIYTCEVLRLLGCTSREHLGIWHYLVSYSTVSYVFFFVIAIRQGNGLEEPWVHLILVWNPASYEQNITITFFFCSNKLFHTFYQKHCVSSLNYAPIQNEEMLTFYPNQHRSLSNINNINSGLQKLILCRAQLCTTTYSTCDKRFRQQNFYT